MACKHDMGRMREILATKEDVWSAPNDVPHPNWELSDFQYEDKDSWAGDSPMLFWEVFEKRVKENPSKVAVSWVEINGKISKTFTYIEIS